MLFVSQKETQFNENLQDTSLHNVREQAQAQARSDGHEHEHLQEPSSGSSDFFCPPHARIPKLTKEQLDLHKEFLLLGTTLMAENPDVFFGAMKLLSDKYKLKVAMPATSIQDNIPCARRVRQNHTTANGAAVDGFVAPRPQSRKYVVPKEVADKEFFKCLDCSEQHDANSFSHQCPSSSVRWHCPFCNHFYAVTSRSAHLRSKHSLLPQKAAKEKQPVPTPEEALKRPRDDVEEESSLSSPAEKVRICTSSPSADSLQSYTPSSCSAVVEEVPADTAACSFSPSMSLFSDSYSDDYELQPLFPVLPEEDSY